MRVEFDCPLCHRAVHAPPALEGTSFPCPSCAGDVRSWPAPNAAAPPVVYFNFSCEMCGIVVAAERAQVGATARCSTCGSLIVVPPLPPEPPPADPLPVLGSKPAAGLRAGLNPVRHMPRLRSSGGTIVVPSVRLPRLEPVTWWAIAWCMCSLIGIGLLWSELGIAAAAFGPLMSLALVFGFAGIHYGQTPCYRCGSRWAGRRWEPICTDWGRTKEDTPGSYRCSKCGARI